MELSNVKQALSNGESVKLYIHLSNQFGSEMYPFTREGFNKAERHWLRIREDALDSRYPESSIKLMYMSAEHKMSNGEYCRTFKRLDSSLLTRVQMIKWKEFLSIGSTAYTLKINGNVYRFQTYASLVSYLVDELRFRSLIKEWMIKDVNILDYSRDVLDCRIVES